jgi:FAD/FMN-containing dehydrogenase
MSADTVLFNTSWDGTWRGEAAAVVLSESMEELAAIVRLCIAADVPMVAQGGNTGLTGTGSPRWEHGESVVSLKRMQKIREVDPVNNTLTVDAGVVLADAQAVADQVNPCY